MGIITKKQTSSYEEWQELRSHYIGGSDAAAVIGLNSFSSPYALWAEKTGRIPGFDGNLATEVGTYLEDFVARKFTYETGKKVRRVNQSFLNSDYPWAIANIDRDIVGEDAGLEIKTTGELNLKRFKNGEYPANYYCQCVHYMAVTGKRRWYLAVLIGNREFRWFTIERDEDEISALMSAEKDFWELVKNDTPPLPDGAEATSDTLTALFPNSDTSTADLAGHNRELDEYMALKQSIKELTKQMDCIANTIKELMGDSGRGESGEFRVSWTSSKRRSFDARRFASEHPDIDLTDYYNESSTRTFRVTKQKGV